jgi:hypothetical protein
MVLGFSSGPIRMVFMLFDPLTAKAINFLRDGSGRIWRPWVGLASLGWSCVLGLVLRPWVGLIVLLVRVLLGWSLCSSTL